MKCCWTLVILYQHALSRFGPWFFARGHVLCVCIPSNTLSDQSVATEERVSEHGSSQRNTNRSIPITSLASIDYLACDVLGTVLSSL